MQQRDFIKDEIEKFVKVVGKLIADMLNMDVDTDVSDVVVISKTRMKQLLGIDLDILLDMDEDATRTFVEARNYTHDHMDALALYLSKLARVESEEVKLVKALQLLDIARDISHTITLERMQLRDDIQRELSRCNILEK